MKRRSALTQTTSPQRAACSDGKYCMSSENDRSANSAVWTLVVFLFQPCALIIAHSYFQLHKCSVRVEEFTSARRGCWMFTPPKTKAWWVTVVYRLIAVALFTRLAHAPPRSHTNPRLGPNRSSDCLPPFPVKDTLFPNEWLMSAEDELSSLSTEDASH